MTAQKPSIAPIDKSISLQIITAVDPIASAPIIANCTDKLPKFVNVKNLGAKIPSIIHKTISGPPIPAELKNL
jgi:hypothetical protein